MSLHEPADEPTIAQSDSTTGSSPSSPVGTTLALAGHDSARYVVVERIGHGGMGTVWRAYDPRLRREVALKRLRTDVLDLTAESRLVREAQAMARLSHPNVVAVYDVQRSTDGMELAMELVEGVTLQEWLEVEPRPQAEVLAAFRRAGEGLAAAHRVGLVHRDFKPSNVLVGHDRSVKVTDFGLAKALTGVPSSELTESWARGDRSSQHDTADPLGAPLTRAGTIMGTLRYMAPEQISNGSVDERSDQYAFCVALWCALTGQPPFPHRYEPMVAAKREGPPPWPSTVRLARGLVEAIRRGLAPAPDARWPSMEALLTALDTGSSRRLQQLGLLAAAVGTAGLAVLGAVTPEPPDERCRGAAEQLRGAWDDERRAEIERALATGEAASGASAMRALDDYGTRWVAQHEDACAATTLRGEQSTAVMDLRMRCLSQARMQLRATTELLATGDAAVVRKALSMIEGLPALSSCEDLERLAAQRPEPDDPEVAARVEATREQLARVAALEQAGKWDEGLALVQAQVAIAEELGFPPLSTRARFQQALLLQRLGRYEDALALLHAVIEAALAQGDDAVAGQGAGLLSNVLANDLGRLAEAQWLAMLSVGLAEQDPHDHYARGAAYGDHATVLCQQGKLVECEAQRRAALEQLEQVGQPRRIALAHDNLARVLIDEGKLDEGKRELDRALELYASSLGLDHPELAHVHTDYSTLYFRQSRFDEASAAVRRALELYEKGQGPGSPWAISMRGNLGAILSSQGKLDEAEQMIREALAATSPGELRTAQLHGQLGDVLLDMERYDEAAAELERSLVQHEAITGPVTGVNALLQFNLGRVHERRGRPALALERYERAWEIAQSVDVKPYVRAAMALGLAKGLWAAAEGSTRARVLAEQARGLLGDAADERSLRDEIDAWLATTIEAGGRAHG